MPNPSEYEIVHQGWLTKSPPSKGIFRLRWRKRWFVLRAGTFPNQFLLEYYTDDSAKRLKGDINLDECEQLVGPLSVQERHKHTFQIRTRGRTYFLAADSESEMSKWVSSLCHVCSLKSVDEESEGGTVYSRTGDDNKSRKTKGPEVLPREDATESDDSSPTLSNKVSSGPYIPISECFTGKPILPHQMVESTYCNSSVFFQFPPKVNWATHPSKRDQSDSEATPTPTSAGPNHHHHPNVPTSSGDAPPRPPKPRPRRNYSPVALIVSSPSREETKQHTYMQTQEEMKGTYLQIDCQAITKAPQPLSRDDNSPKFPMARGSSSTFPRKPVTPTFHAATDSNSVEYRMIDPVKTKALTKTIEDRAKQIRNNTLSRSHH